MQRALCLSLAFKMRLTAEQTMMYTHTYILIYSIYIYIYSTYIFLIVQCSFVLDEKQLTSPQLQMCPTRHCNKTDLRESVSRIMIQYEFNSTKETTSYSSICTLKINVELYELAQYFEH